MQSEADRKQVMIMDELKRLREAAGLSQVQLALRLGVSPGHYSTLGNRQTRSAGQAPYKAGEHPRMQR